MYIEVAISELCAGVAGSVLCAGVAGSELCAGVAGSVLSLSHPTEGFVPYSEEWRVMRGTLLLVTAAHS